ncbi:MAG: hypothetical protein HKN46_09795 [Acidimicrobiia bacterium]|nr:hypothetical protein [Acidimicrobiia bacterium]
MRSLLSLLVLSLVLAACSPNEEPLTGLRNCDVLEAGKDYGTSLDLPEAETELFSRPGRYIGAQAAFVSGLAEPVFHVSRSNGPCGQHDLFVSVSESGWCAVVVGRDWDRSVCVDDLSTSTWTQVEVADAGGWVTLVRAPGAEVTHTLFGTSVGTVAAFVRDGFALAVLPEQVTSIEIVEFDGDSQTIR